MKKVIVACGSGIAVSQIVCMKVKRQLEERGIQAELIPISVYDLTNYIEIGDIYIKLVKTEETYDIPTIDGTMFLSRDPKKEEQAFEQLIALLNRICE